MVFRYTYRGGIWIDLENPSESEARAIIQEFSIDERLEDEFLSPTPASIVASGENTTFLVLHFPTNGALDGESRDQEVDFIVSKNFIITIHYEVIASLHRLKKLLETQQMVTPSDDVMTDVLLEILFTHLYTSVRDHINHIVDRLAHIERDLFNNLEHTTVRPISNINREFLHIDAALASQEEPLSRFLKMIAARQSFDASFAERSERIRSERSQIERLARTHHAVATELRETNMALLESRQNAIMKTLTVITVIAMPVELVILIFSMHVPGTPLEQNPNAFWIILTLMVGFGGTTMALFLKKRWLS